MRGEVTRRETAAKLPGVGGAAVLIVLDGAGEDAARVVPRRADIPIADDALRCAALNRPAVAVEIIRAAYEGAGRRAGHAVELRKIVWKVVVGERQRSAELVLAGKLSRSAHRAAKGEAARRDAAVEVADGEVAGPRIEIQFMSRLEGRFPSVFWHLWPKHHARLCYIGTMGEANSDQAAVLDFMASHEAYGSPAGPVDRIETHASVVFLAGSHAYKIKRAVKYPFLDFSTLEKRHRALRNELALNRRTAPQLYFEVIPITIGDDTRFHLGGKGEAKEWALVMRRFDQAKLYDRLAEEGRLPLPVMPQLAQVIADFHRGANRFLAPETSVAALLAVLKDNETALAGEKGAFPAEALATVNRGSRDALASLALLLRARASGGYVRHCHGDLHLRNIVEIDGAPVLFDAIEFNDAIATVDVLYDLAFLLMDLGARGLRVHANAVLNAYLEASGDTGNLIGLAALPLFLSTRAMIRAKVELLRASLDPQSQGEARRRATSYVLLARDYLERQRPQLIAIGGLSGSGKSSVAQALAPHLGVFPGAVHVRSDVERKRLFGVAPGERLPGPAYAAEVSDIVYTMCRKRALMALEGGHSVIVDAVHAKEEERDAVAGIAARAGAAFTGIWLEAPVETMRQRIAVRTGDASDATQAVLDEQLSFDLGQQTFAVIEAGRPLDEVVRSCLKVIRSKLG